MKHLKSFNQINESELWNIFNRLNKTYMDIDESKYDYIMDDLSDIKGRHQITESDKQRILKILNGYLKPEVTGIEFNGFTQTNPHEVSVYFKTKVGIDPDFLIHCYNDDYFVIQVNVPVVYPTRVEKESISMITLYCIIDGWDGFEEWAQKTTPYDDNEEMYILLKSRLRELDSEMKSIDHNKFLELCRLYPHVRMGIRKYHFFDGGNHIATLQVSMGGEGILQCHKSYKEKLF
jgi:hypothetical protein